MSKKWIHIFFPKRCLACKTLILPEEALCEDCAEKLYVIPEPICLGCGLSQAECECNGKKTPYSGVLALFYYEDVAMNAMQNFKFYGSRHSASFFSSAMISSIKENLSDISFDMIVPVPMSKKSTRKRGFNQSRILAEDISKVLNIPCITSLIKVQENRQQHFLSAAEREGNVFGVFDVEDGDIFEGKKVLLCDDIKTTGATLKECAQVLKIHGAKEVFCVTACATRQLYEKR